MTTNIYLGFPFGVLSVFFHALLVATDPRKSYRFYNFSLLCWVIGNFMWMTVEFVDVNPSSNVHLGSHVPLGGIPENIINDMVNAKTILFLIASVVQVGMYISVYCKLIPMPEGEDEDIVSRNELLLLCYGSKSYTQQQQQHVVEDNVDLGDDITLNTAESSTPNYGFTLAYIDNLYIIFWISKDLFWSWGTGDLINGFKLAIFYETFALCFGTLALLVHVVSAYIYRRNTLMLLDTITTIFWISANFVWMCGEFFLRYDNLTYDDEDEGNDSDTRIASAVLFILGLTIQLYILISFIVHKRNSQWKQNSPQVEMTVRYQNILITFSPQHERQEVPQEDEEEESTILF